MWVCHYCQKENDEKYRNCTTCRTPRKNLQRTKGANDEETGDVKKILMKLEQKIPNTTSSPCLFRKQYTEQPVLKTEGDAGQAETTNAQQKQDCEYDRQSPQMAMPETSEVKQPPPASYKDKWEQLPSITGKATDEKRISKVQQIPGLDISGIAPNEMRIVFIGKTGTGKSATANTILGTEEFISMLRGKSVTAACKLANGNRFGKKLVLVDTPGLFDTGMTNERVTKEIVKCIGMTAPGPHAFLLVVAVGRFTKEEYDTVKHFVDNFGEGMYKYLVVVFTRKDDLDNDRVTIDEYVQDVPEDLKKVLRLCDHRYVAFNNRLKEKENAIQVKQLMEKIEDMVRVNGGRYYTNDMYEEAEKVVIKRQEEIKREIEEKKQREMQVLRNQLSKEFHHQIEKSEQEKQRLEKEMKYIKLESQNAEKRAEVLTQEMSNLRTALAIARQKSDLQTEKVVLKEIEEMEIRLLEIQKQIREEHQERERQREQAETLKLLQNQLEEEKKKTQNEQRDAELKKQLKELEKQKEEIARKEKLRLKAEQEEKDKIAKLEREKIETQLKFEREQFRIQREHDAKEKELALEHERALTHARDKVRTEVENENPGIFAWTWRTVKGWFGY